LLEHVGVERIKDDGNGWSFLFRHADDQHSEVGVRAPGRRARCNRSAVLRPAGPQAL